MDGERDGEDLPAEDSKVRPSLGASARSKSGHESLTFICGHTRRAAGRACRHVAERSSKGGRTVWTGRRSDARREVRSLTRVSVELD